MAVGTASSIYHTTLKYHTAMLDEMSMHVATGSVLIQVFTFNESMEIRKRNTAIIVGSLTAFVIYHCVTDEFVLHIVVFFICTVSVAIKTSRIIQEQVKDEQHKKKLNGLARFASSEYGLDFE